MRGTAFSRFRVYGRRLRNLATSVRDVSKVPAQLGQSPEAPWNASSSPWQSWRRLRCARHGARCEAWRRSRCGTSPRSRNEADGPVPPQPFGRKGFASPISPATADCYSFPTFLLIPFAGANPAPRDLRQFCHGLLGSKELWWFERTTLHAAKSSKRVQGGEPPPDGPECGRSLS